MNTLISYQNRYGSLQLTPASDYMSVSKISHKIAPIGCAFSIATAEEIALITDNRNIQISFIPGNMHVCYVMHHISTSMAAICQIVSMEFTAKVIAEVEIKRLQKAFV